MPRRGLFLSYLLLAFGPFGWGAGVGTSEVPPAVKDNSEEPLRIPEGRIRPDAPTLFTLAVRGADAVADAKAAAERNDFGMILTGTRDTYSVGLACFTPYGRPPRVLASLPHGDVIDETVMRWTEYARNYNRVLVNHPDYPDPDLCRAVTEQEEGDAFEPMPDREARPVRSPDSHSPSSGAPWRPG